MFVPVLISHLSSLLSPPPPAPEDPPPECGAGGPLHGGGGGPSSVHSAPLQPQPGGPHHHPGLAAPGPRAGPGPLPAG